MFISKVVPPLSSARFIEHYCRCLRTLFRKPNAMTADDDHLQRLIGDIYDSAIDPSHWPDTLARIAASLGGNAAVISDKNFCNNQKSFVLQAGMCEEIQRLYVDHYLKADLRFAVAQNMPVGSILHEPMFITETEMDHSEYYQEFLRPFDFRYCVGGALESSPDWMCGVAIQRSPRAGVFTPVEIERFKTLLPHMRRALLIQRRLETLQRRERILVEMIDRIPIGVIILDGDAHPVVMNKMAEAITAAEDGLRCGHDGLAAARSRENAALQRLIAGALATSIGQSLEGGGAIHVTRHSGKPALNISVVPASPAVMQELALSGPHALVLVADPALQPQVVLTPTFIEFYGLTPAEARLLEALVNGASPEQCHLQFGVSMATVRKHLQSVFGKTGTNRQSDLVRLVLSNPLQATLDSRG